MGGRIALQDIILHIPSEALEQDTLITLGLVWERQMFDSFRSGNEDVVLSPVVVCQPNGLQLKQPCIFEIPHCAYQPNTTWTMNVKMCHGDLFTTCPYKWNKVSNHSIVIQDITVVIDVNYFTLYTCGKSFGAPPKVSDSTQLLVFDTGKDVILEMDNLNDEWTVLGSCYETLPFALVWEAYTPHCTLVFEGATLAGIKSEKLVCDILAYQEGNDNNVGKLKIAENVFGELPESLVQIQSQRNQVAETLKEMIDPINECATNAGDWQALAEKMGCRYCIKNKIGLQTSAVNFELVCLKRQVVKPHRTEHWKVVEPNLNEHRQVVEPHLNENRQVLEAYLNGNRQVAVPNLNENRLMAELYLNDNETVEVRER
ncbi:uncharacterized protein LOC128221631 [Mya arenaria]|uniref:uncharacterized protein LOC128221631 n=1 Tax=Mya arenaria TaxID=6604 RepID=UPI0022DFA090|nr:uncharacterized protein LOC128221631 [Mya arenaria]